MIKKMAMPMVAGVVGIVLLLVVIAGAITGGLEEDNQSSGGVFDLVAITFTGEIDGDKISLTADYNGQTISGIDGEVKEDGTFTANYKNAEGMASLPLPGPPASRTTFTYMPHFDQSLYPGTNLWEGSDQMKFDQGCTTDERGYRRYGEAYLIALGSFYGSKIGQEYVLTFKQGDGSTKTIKAVLGDQKADKDTDEKHQYHKIDHSIVEFIMGDRDSHFPQMINEDFGELTSIKRKSGVEFALIGKIDGESITITGTVDGIPVSAAGTVKDGKITASGYVGDMSSLGNGEFVGVGEWKGGKLQWPLPGFTNITGKYGTDRGDHIHAGIDIGTHGTEGVPCVAAADGVVVKNVPLAQGGARGHYVDIAHGGGLVTRYQHLQPGTGIAVGTQVKAGDPVGITGGSGFGVSRSYAIHLHFEVLTNYSGGQGTPNNPVLYLK